MADQTVTVVLRAQASQFVAGMAEANRSVDQFTSNSRRQLDRLGVDWGQMGRTASQGFAVAAGGAGALAVSLGRVGIGYNNIEARSRTAMNTLMGDTRRANALMDDLFEFTSESPFAREVFIEGTQQLIGFGMEAQKVVPTLAAIEDAMAAVGRGNQDIAEVIEILSQITSSGKITALELRRLGIRGVDAAGLIGDAMGKTAGQVRDEITNGTLDATVAVDALVLGMTDRFGGAAANMKQLMDGAAQAIGARWRNLGSDLSEPFVSTSGGGAAVEWAHQFGNMLSALRRSAVPALIPYLERAADAGSNLVDTIEALVEAVDADDITGFIERVAPMAPALSGAAGAVTAFGATALPVLGRIPGLTNPVVMGLAAMAAVSPEVRAALIELGESLVDLMVAAAPAVETLATLASVLITGLGAPAVEGIAGALGVIADVVGEFPGLVTAAALAFVALKGGMLAIGAAETLRGLFAAGGAIDGLRLKAMYARGAASNMATALGPAGMAGAAGLALIAVGGLAYSIQQSRQRAEEARQRIRLYADAIREAEDAAEGAATVIEEWLRADIELARTFDNAGVSVRDFTDAAIEGGDAWEIMKDRLIDGAEAAGMSGLKLEYFGRTLNQARDEILQGADDADILNRVLGDTGDAAEGSVDPMDAYRDALADVGDEAADAAGDVRDLLRAMDDFLRMAFGAENAAIAWEESLHRLREHVTENGTTLDITTEAGRRNREMIQRLVEAGKDRIAQMIEEGASAEDVADAHALITLHLADLLEQMGFNREEAQRYAEALANIPTEVTTTLTYVVDFDADAATARAREVNRLVRDSFGPGISLGNALNNPAHWGGGRAAGGPVQPGHMYLVGERGPEVLAMGSTGGYVHSASSAMTRAVMGGDGESLSSFAPGLMTGPGHSSYSSTDNSDHSSTTNLTVNNPAPEPASTSVSRELRRVQALEFGS